jgi:hypothetical protein
MVTQSASLLCHPATPCDAVRAIAVSASRATDGTLRLTFRADGDLARIRVPPPQPPRVVHQLWEHTCFEAFVTIDAATAYHELNFSPSSEWAGYRFRSYREIEGLVEEDVTPRITARCDPKQLEVVAALPLARLAPAYLHAPLRLGLSAVIESSDGARSYWALRHPGGKPDFHDALAFTLRLEPPRGEW